MALANDPEVLLCDEPTGELDAQSAGRVLELLSERAAGGGAVLVVTHNPSVSALRTGGRAPDGRTVGS